MQDYKIELNQQEVNAIMEVLGNLPTKTGAWVLLAKIGAQVNEQSPNKPAEETKAE